MSAGSSKASMALSRRHSSGTSPLIATYTHLASSLPTQTFCVCRCRCQWLVREPSKRILSVTVSVQHCFLIHAANVMINMFSCWIYQITGMRALTQQDDHPQRWSGQRKPKKRLLNQGDNSGATEKREQNGCCRSARMALAGWLCTSPHPTDILLAHSHCCTSRCPG